MKFGPFSRIDLPLHNDEEFSNVLLGFNEHRTAVKGRGSEKMGSRAALQKLLLRAREAYFRGFYHDGLKYYARALSLDELDPAAWTGQIRILVDVGRYDSAIYWADRSLRRLGGSDLVRNAKAFALASAGRISEAKEIINVPVGTEEVPMIWLLRGEVLLKIKISFIQKLFTPHKGIGRMGAFFCFLRALSPEPNDSFINQRIGLTYLLAGDVARAMEHLIFSLQVAPENPLTLYGLARCSTMINDNEQALSYVKRAIAGNPKLDCAFELLEWLHNPRLRNIRKLFSIKKRRR